MLHSSAGSGWVLHRHPLKYRTAYEYVYLQGVQMEAETQPAAAASDGTGAALTTSDALYHCEIEGRDAICQKIKGDLRDGNLDQRHVTKIKLSGLAATKILMHAKQGVEAGVATNGFPLEVMGLLFGAMRPRPPPSARLAAPSLSPPPYRPLPPSQPARAVRMFQMCRGGGAGYPMDDGKTVVVTDAFEVPAAGGAHAVEMDPETSVYMAELTDSLRQTRPEGKICGWYAPCGSGSAIPPRSQTPASAGSTATRSTRMRWTSSSGRTTTAGSRRSMSPTSCRGSRPSKPWMASPSWALLWTRRLRASAAAWYSAPTESPSMHLPQPRRPHAHASADADHSVPGDARVPQLLTDGSVRPGHDDAGRTGGAVRELRARALGRGVEELLRDQDRILQLYDGQPDHGHAGRVAVGG